METSKKLWPYYWVPAVVLSELQTKIAKFRSPGTYVDLPIFDGFPLFLIFNLASNWYFVTKIVLTCCEKEVF